MIEELTTDDGRHKLRVEVEHDMARGRSFYTITGGHAAGVYTLEPDDSYHLDEPREYVHLHYGRHLTSWAGGYECLPDGPRPFGVPIVGGWVFHPDSVRNPQRYARGIRAAASRYLGPRTSQGAPDATCRLLGQVGVALADHWLGSADYAVVLGAWLAAQAPGRLAQHRREIDRLQEEIAKLEERLEVEMEKADRQALLVEPAELVWDEAS